MRPLVAVARFALVVGVRTGGGVGERESQGETDDEDEDDIFLFQKQKKKKGVTLFERHTLLAERCSVHTHRKDRLHNQHQRHIQHGMLEERVVETGLEQACCTWAGAMGTMGYYESLLRKTDLLHEPELSTQEWAMKTALQRQTRVDQEGRTAVEMSTMGQTG